MSRSYWLKPTEIYKDVRYIVRWRIPGFFQRAWRGWAARDTWSFDHYLAEVIASALRHMAKHAHGVPYFIFEENPELDEEKHHNLALLIWKRWLTDKAEWFAWYAKDEIGFDPDMTDEQKSQALDFYDKKEKHFLEVVLPDFGKRFPNLWD